MGQSKSKPKRDPASKVKGAVESNAGEESTDPQKNGSGPELAKTEDGKLSNRKSGEVAAKKLKRNRTSFYETVDASEVLPYLIIGNLASSKDDDFLIRKNVKYILNLTLETNDFEGMQCKNVPLEDDDDQELSPYLDTCFDFIHRASQEWEGKDKAEGKGGTVLVHSYFGMSRSSAIVIAYLMKEKKWSLRVAYDHLKERHSSINPNDNFAVQLIRYEQEMFNGTRSMSVTDFRH